MSDGGAAAGENPEIVPRWEWRVFGTSFPRAEAFFSALDPVETKESHEVYLAHDGEENVKIRDGLLDVKKLFDVDAHGLQLWRPVMKASFPLGDTDVARFCELLGREPPPRPRTLTEDALLRLLEADPGSAAVPVAKRRVRYLVDGCMAEVSDIEAAGIAVRTIAVEGPDPTAVRSLVDEVGLGSRENTSYSAGLRALLGRLSSRSAVIDIGTNSVKLLVADTPPGGGMETIVEKAEVTRLGEGLTDGGDFGIEAMDRTVRSVVAMAAEARRLGARHIAAVGTAGLRMAANRGELLDRIRDETAVDVEVISGEEESRLAFLAVAAEAGPIEGAIVVFDTGGGSSQFTFGKGGRVDEQFSVPIGAVRVAETFDLDGVAGLEAVAAARAAIGEELAGIRGRPAAGLLIGIGGAVTNLTAVSLGMVDYDPERIRGTRLERAEVERQIELYRTTDTEDRRSIPGLQPKRAEVILAGACIVGTVMELLGVESLTVSDRGLRHGVYAERFGRA
jgi:exopolyphosphatase/guanosine-5'-triphosphate,3'-diphosphate pyrophosphatase